MAKLIAFPTLDQSPWFESRQRRNSAHGCMALHCAEPFIIVLSMSWYDLHMVERDINH